MMSVDKLNEQMYLDLLPVTVFIGMELTIGLAGNCLILCVYSRAYANCNFRYFVLFMAVYDLTSCVTTLPGELYAHFNWYDYKYNWLCKIKSYFNVFTAWGSAFTLFLLALDRCMKICRPLGRQIAPSLAWKLCLLGLVLSTLVSAPILFLWGLQFYTYEGDGIKINVSICEKSSTHKNSNYPFIYISSVYIGPIGLMMAAICVCNILLARKLMCRMLTYKGKNNTCAITSTRGIHKDSSFTSITAVTENNVTADTCISTPDAMQTPPPCVSKVRRASTGQYKRSLWRFSSVYTIDNKHDKENFEEVKKTSILTSISEHIHKGTTGSSMRRNSGRTAAADRTKRRKTLIMLTLTSVYIVTMTMYICLVSLVAEKDGILRKLSGNEKVVFFFFLRLYFINTCINPILYGIMDPRFRSGLKHLLC